MWLPARASALARSGEHAISDESVFQSSTGHQV
jgi:hypothetical protein